MMGVINPVVNREGSRREWLISIVMYLVGLLTTSAATGALIGWMGARIGGGVEVSLLTTLLAALSLAYGLNELELVRLPYPQLRAQVPNRWRRRFKLPVVSLLYGLGLGVSFFTHIPSGAFYPVLAGIFLMGDPWWGAVLFAATGLGRWLILLPVGGATDACRLSGLTTFFLRVDNKVQALCGMLLLAAAVWFFSGAYPLH